MGDRRGPRQIPGENPRAVASEDTILEAIRHVDAASAAVIEPLQRWLDDHPGVRAQVPLRTLFVGMTINALLQNDGFITNTTRVLRGLPPRWRQELQVEVDGHLATYRQVWTVWRRARQGIRELNTTVDDPTLTSEDAANWVANRIVRTSLPANVALGPTRAIDSTDIEAHARTRTDPSGRRWTKDPDMLEGHSPAKNGEPGGVRFMAEYHLSVAVKEENGSDVPGLITGAFLGQPNVDRARAVLFLVDDERAHGDNVNEIVIDRGYTNYLEERLALPLLQRGVDKTIDLLPTQRAPQPPFRGAISRDGSLFCPVTPEPPNGLEPPSNPGLSADKIRERIARFDERYRYSFRVRQAAKVANGAARMECPARAGHVRCELVGASLRQPHTKPTVTPPSDPPPCCTQATLTVPAEHNVRIRQKHPFGTTKWKHAYNRRPAVETANSLIKTHFATVRRGYTQVFGLEAQALLLAFTLVAANIRLLESYRYRTAA
jgi:hypothetical protein